MQKIPYDIPSFNQSELPDPLCWPSPYDQYSFISYDLITGALNILNSTDGNLQIALTCKLSEILIDLSNVLRQAIDIENAKVNNIQLIHNPQFSPVYDWFINGGNGADQRIINRLNPSVTDGYLKSQLILYARLLKRSFAKKNTPNSYNAINYNLLMKEWINKEQCETHNLLYEYYFNKRTSVESRVFEHITAEFQELSLRAHDFSTYTKTSLLTAVKMIVQKHMCQALSDLRHLQKSGLHKNLRKGLISGTPKYHGRMLGWYFMDNNKDVIRFAHGGERVFYKDYAWPIAELPYCTEYYAHSQTEASNMHVRVQNEEYAITTAMKNIAFKSNGSIKHQCLYDADIKPNYNKTVIYVTSVYEHDRTPGLPAFKVPDPLYFDFQIRMLKFLKSKGWKIILKPHPKGLYNENDYLAPYVDDIVKTSFNPNEFEAELFLFDFAGTAFFDTIITNQRVALLNLGFRPLDERERVSLSKRCHISDVGFDKNNRLNFNGEELLQAFSTSPQNISHDFIENYTT